MGAELEEPAMTQTEAGFLSQTSVQETEPAPSSTQSASVVLDSPVQSQPKAAAGATPVGKRSRPTTSSALGNISDGLDRFTDVLAAVGTGRPLGLDATSVRKNKAVKRVETMESDLDDEQKLDLMDLFCKDVTMADAYLSIESDSLRKSWVQRRLFE
ncbi:hypothetical protein C8Q76DRAFT_708295 [Earliella scabrosa]|nr:hypothetical protein C8Q76DRAFT_708295 [Earliella scabrosa]